MSLVFQAFCCLMKSIVQEKSDKLKIHARTFFESKNSNVRLFNVLKHC